MEKLNKIQKNLLRLKKYFLGKTVVIPSEKNKDKLKLTKYDDRWLSNSFGFTGKHNLSLYNNNLNNTNSYSRLYLFREYDMMERDPIISRSLDILAQGACQKNEYDEVVTVTSDSKNIKASLDHLFNEIIGVNYSLKNYTRSMLKYGDMFAFHNIQEKFGIVDYIPLSAIDTQREEYENGETKFTSTVLNRNKEYGEEHFTHFRNNKNIESYPYGTSHLEPIRRYWKMLSLLEDFMMVYYLLRSVNPRVFKIQVGNLNRDDALEYIRNYKDMFKKVPLQDDTGEYDLYYDPISQIEDIFLPVREGYENTTFDEIPNGTETSIVEGIEYLRRKMMSGLGVPNFMLNYEEQINSRSVAAGEDIRLGETLESIQEIIIDELIKIANIHLILQGYSEKDLLNFEITMTPPSDLKEIEMLERIEARISTAEKAINSEFYSKKWVYENILNLGEEEIEKMKQEILNDKLDVKADEEWLESFEFNLDEEEEDVDGGSEDEGEGSEGGQLPSGTSPDEDQLDSRSGRAEDLMDARQSDDESRRITTTDDIDPE